MEWSRSSPYRYSVLESRELFTHKDSRKIRPKRSAIESTKDQDPSYEVEISWLLSERKKVCLGSLQRFPDSIGPLETGLHSFPPTRLTVPWLHKLLRLIQQKTEYLRPTWPPFWEAQTPQTLFIPVVVRPEAILTPGLLVVEEGAQPRPPSTTGFSTLRLQIVRKGFLWSVRRVTSH